MASPAPFDDHIARTSREAARSSNSQQAPRASRRSGPRPLTREPARWPRCLAPLALAALLLGPRPAGALIGDRLDAFGIDGSIRTLTLATRNTWQWAGRPYDGGDGVSQLNLRLVAGGEPLSWLRFEVHGVQILSLEPPGMFGGGGGVVGAEVGGSTWRLHPARWEWGERRGDLRARLWLDRCEIKIATEHADLAIGRQAISFGKAWFWNPLDVFTAFAPLELDRDYKPGVDALRVDLPLGELSGLTVVAAMGDLGADRPAEELGVIVRLTGTLRGIDLALQAGRLRGGWQAGFAAAGEIEPLDLRAELSWVRPKYVTASAGQAEAPRAGEHIEAVLGVSRRFESTLNLAAELLYHDGGPEDLGARLALSGSRDLLQASRLVSGLTASYDLLPVLVGSVAVLTTWDTPSGLIQPGLTWSAADEVDVILGGFVSLGDRPEMRPLMPLTQLFVPAPRSELGTYPHMFWARFVAHF